MGMLALELIALVAMVVAARSEGNDAAGRGLATVYILAFAAPVALAAIAYVAGYWRVAGALTLILPVAIAVLWFGRGGRGRDAAMSVSRSNDAVTTSDGANDWFDNPRVDALLRALASPDAGALEQFRGDDAVLNAISTDGSRTTLTYVAPRFPGSIGTLISLGADPNRQPPQGMHPVLSSLDDDPMVLRQLLDNGANPNAELRARQDALQQAIERGKRMHALLLVEHGASLEAPDARGRSPLMTAIEHREWQVALQLVQRGANPGRTAADGRTVASMLADPELAAWRDHADYQRLVEELKRRGMTIKGSP